MKINEQIKTHTPDKVQDQAKIDPGRKGDFAKTLAEVAGAKDASPTTHTARMASQGLMNANPAGQIMAAKAAPSPETQLEQTLSLLASYAEELADPSRNLKQISPMVDDMEMHAGRLDKLSRSLPNDHRMKPLVDQTAVLAAVEAVKFRRGDYN